MDAGELIRRARLDITGHGRTDIVGLGPRQAYPDVR